MVICDFYLTENQIIEAKMSNGNSAEASTSPSPALSSIGNNAPKFGTLVPNRVFVGGISGNTTEQDLLELFAKYGKVKATKVISDRAGVSKGYGFVTFETEEEARKLTQEADNIMLKDRKLNIAPAIKKQVNDLGYIKPYSPRLVDGNAPATVLGTNGTVFFGNGTSYAYTTPMPVLANPNEYHQAVAGVPNHAAAHPTFPQVPQTGAHTAVTAAAQVAGTPTAAGYPAQLVYPQAMYFPQQYQQYHTTAIQPQWAASPQFRWVSPGAYTQPECSSLSGEASSEESYPKGTQNSHHFSVVSPPPSHVFTPPYRHDNLPYPSPPISATIHSTYPSISHAAATTSTTTKASTPCYGAATSITVNTTTTTTTTAVIGSNFLNGDFKSNELFGDGPLQIKPLLGKTPEKQKVVDHSESCEDKQTSSYGGNRTASALLPAVTSAIIVHKKNRSRTPSAMNTQRTSESSSGSEDIKASNNNNSPLLNWCPKMRKMKPACRIQMPHQKSSQQDGESSRSDSPSLDMTGTNHPQTSQCMTLIQPCGIHPSHSSIGGAITGMWPVPNPLMNWSTWCPQHNIGSPLTPSPQSVHFPMYPPVALSGLGQNTVHLDSSGSTVRKMIPSCGSPHSQVSGSPSSSATGSPETSSVRKKIVEPYGEDAVIGKPVLKVDQMIGTELILGEKPGAMAPIASPFMMVPCFQYGPMMNPPWYHWPAPPMYMSRFPISVNPHTHYCTNYTPTQASMTTVPISSHAYNPKSPLNDSVSHCTLPHKLHLSSNCSTHEMQHGRRSFPFSNDVASKTFIPASDSSIKPGKNPQTNCWSRFPPHYTQAAASHSDLGESPSKKSPVSFLGEPVRCLRRLAQLPDDKYALLPLSPPFTPVTGEKMPASITSLSHSQPTSVTN